MYTTDIGRKFIDLYNEKSGSSLSSETYFEDNFFPLFFDSEDYLHLMQVTNSSFFQSLPKEDHPSGIPKPTLKKDRFVKQLDDVVKHHIPVSGAIAVGYMAGEVEKGTSGQVSNIEYNLDKRSLLNSWFGGALGVGFGGGYNLLFQEPEINWFTYQGWRYYREYLNGMPRMKGRQIETWNGIWLLNGLKFRNDPQRAYKEVKSQISRHLSEDKNIVSLRRPEWLRQIVSLANILGKEKGAPLLVNGYKFAQMNVTLGFLYLKLPEVRKLNEIYDHYLEHDHQATDKSKKAIENVYKTQYSLERASAQGGIGLRALKPKDLYKYTAGSTKKEVAAIPKLDKEEKRNQFRTYLTWITAMLNNQEMLELSEKLAQDLNQFAEGDKRLNERAKLIQKLWKSYNRQLMIDTMVEIHNEEASLKEVLNDTVNILMKDLPQDNFRLFLTLTKFKFHYNQNGK